MMRPWRPQKLQQESLDAEQAKFDVGASTSFFIIQYQSFLAQAQIHGGGGQERVSEGSRGAGTRHRHHPG